MPLKQQRESPKKMKKKRNMIQTKEQDKTPLTELNERKISDIPKKEFK